MFESFAVKHRKTGSSSSAIGVQTTGQALANAAKRRNLAFSAKLYHKWDGRTCHALVHICDNLFRSGEIALPSLFRFLAFCAILAGLAYGGMFALATLVEPQEREMRVKIPSDRLNK